jgi:transglutaminase-like putative cysteine protease
MILEIQHETRFEYSEQVTEAFTEVRMEPVSDADQSCCSFRLEVEPQAGLFRYQGGCDNRLHYFNVLAPHKEVCIRAASVVDTHPRLRDLSASAATYPPALDGSELEVLAFLLFRGPVQETPRLTQLVEQLRPAPGSRLADLVAAVSRTIHQQFQYVPNVTQSSSPVDDVLQQGKGVCQDFAHLMIALMRSFGVPARYVSGYIHRPGQDSHSHAWCEVWLPDLGWLGIDPTHDQLVNDHFVKVAIGRDYTDVPPNKGVYSGQAQEKIFVRVETRLLERLPSLSWQEQLPPLHVPLTAIPALARMDLRRDDHVPQQQQQ